MTIEISKINDSCKKNTEKDEFEKKIAKNKKINCLQMNQINSPKKKEKSLENRDNLYETKISD